MMVRGKWLVAGLLISTAPLAGCRDNPDAKADLKPLAHDAFHDVCTPGNPRKATEEDILAIYTSLM